VILVDTSVWIDHLRAPQDQLVAYLEQSDVWVHPFVVGELALGSIKGRPSVVAALRGLPMLPVVADDAVLAFIDSHALHGVGIGYVDAHLLISAQSTRKMRLWTRDRRMRLVVDRLGLAVQHN
jgi:hypothetical protein